MGIIIGIVLVLIFFSFSYYIGNKLGNTFNDDWEEKMISFFMGIFISGFIIGLFYLGYVIFMIGYNAL
jgi:hypothetical protein